MKTRKTNKQSATVFIRLAHECLKSPLSAAMVVTAVIISLTLLLNSNSKPQYYSIISKNISLDICFTPPHSTCANVIAQKIAEAQHSIYVQAYGFTSNTIVNELIRAKQRGVKVSVILDKSNCNAKYSKIKLLRKHKINIRIDSISGIAHNKVMIIDNSIVITGSFNFSANADKSNAENVVIIKDNNAAKLYLENWHQRYLKSIPDYNDNVTK